MLTTGTFLLPVTGLRPGTFGLTLGKPDDVFAFFGTVLLLTFGYVEDLEAISLEFEVFLVVMVPFVVDVLLTLAVSSAFTSTTMSSMSLSAASWSILDADNNSATKGNQKIIKFSCF